MAWRSTGTPTAALAACILCCCCWLLPQRAAAQNFTGLRTGLWVPQQQAIDNTTAARELTELTTKLPQMRPGGPAQQQLLLLSAFSRSKLNNLTGDAEQWLKNRTEPQLEDLFESVRAENLRRALAIAAVGTQLPGAFTSGNVLVALEALATEDLERLASLPLYEPQYQLLTNGTLLDLLQQLYLFGAAQAPQRSCVLTAANTSSLYAVPGSSNTAAATSAGRAPVQITYSTVPYFISGGNRRLRQRSAARRRLLDAVSDTAQHWLDDAEDAAAAVIAAVVTGSRPTATRVLLQQQPAAGSTTPTDASVAPIVVRFVNGLSAAAATSGDASTSSVLQGSGRTSLDTAAAGGASLSGVLPAGVMDGNLVASSCTESFSCTYFRTPAGAARRQAVVSGLTSGGSGGSGGSSGGSNSGGLAPPLQQQPQQQQQPRVAAQVAPNNVAVNCSSGLVFNGTACVPAPPPPCINGTQPDGRPCPPPPCVNGTTPDGRPCPPPLQAPAPCINGSACNSTGSGRLGGPRLEGPLQPCGANGTLADGVTPCNSTALSPIGSVNATTPSGNKTAAAAAVAPLATANVTAPAATLPPPVAGNGSEVPATQQPVGPGGNGSEVPAAQPPAGPGDNGSEVPATQQPVGPGGSTGNSTTPPPFITPPFVPGMPGSNESAPGGLGGGQLPPPPSDGVAGGNGSTLAPPQQLPPPQQQPLPAIQAPGVIGGLGSNSSEGGAAVQPAVAPVAIGNTVAPSPAPADPAALPGVVTPIGGVVSTPAPSGVGASPAPAADAVPAVQPVAPTVVAPAVVAPTAPADVTPPPPEVTPPAVVAPSVQPPQPAVVTQPAATAPVAVAPTTVEQPSPPAPVACAGQYVDSGVCKAACEAAGTLTQTFTVSVPAANGGAACPPPTREVPCTNPTPCPKPPVNCVGSWVESGTCNAVCPATAGTKTSVYSVTTPALNGGATCEAAAGATKEVPCTNPTPCPKPEVVAPAVVAPAVVAPAVVAPAVVAPTIVEPAVAPPTVTTPAVTTPTAPPTTTPAVAVTPTAEAGGAAVAAKPAAAVAAAAAGGAAPPP